ncbi:MAG: hypothetical protein Q9217_000465 [Psora testacea]
MLAIKSNIRIERQPQSSKTGATMPGIATTNSIAKRRITPSKQLVAVPKPAPIPPTVNFPTPATPTRHLFRTPITIIAGTNSAPFPLHLEILLTVSPFFAAAFSPTHTFRDSPLNSPLGTLSLPSLNPSDFEYFIQWLYTRTLDHEDLKGPHPAYFKLIRLYGLADQFCVTALKNAIVDEMGSVADRTNSCPTPDDTKVVWDDESGCGGGGTATSTSLGRSQHVRCGSSGSSGSSEREGTAGGEDGSAHAFAGRESGLRGVISDLFVWKKTDKLVAEHEDQWDESFLREVVVKLKREKGRGESAPWRERGRACARYHVHDEWAPVCGKVGTGV